MSGKKMVDTRRLEKLIRLSETDPITTRAEREVTATGQRALALSGHREMRRAGRGHARSAQREAVIDANWDALSRCVPDPAPERAMHQFNAQVRKSDVVERFDMLRAQLVQRFRSRKLVSLGIAGPTSGNGATFASAGLLASLARRGDQRVIGLDLNLRHATLQKYFEVLSDHTISDFISGEIPALSFLQRVTGTVALGLSQPSEDTGFSPGFSSQDIAQTLGELTTEFAPDMIICDLPPLLQGDTALEICVHLDAVLIVADARRTRADEVLACERLLAGQTEFLGVILNHYTGSEKP